MRLSEHSRHLPYSSLNTSVTYFLCTSEEYATFRAHLFSNNATIEAVTIYGALHKWQHGKNTDKSITMYGRRHSVEPGPCGATIHHLFAPKCDHVSYSAAQGYLASGMETRDSALDVHGVCSL